MTYHMINPQQKEVIAIDETLREPMIQAFLGGDKEEALRLSQELDIQIVEEQLKGGIALEPLDIITSMLDSLQYVPKRYKILIENLNIAQGRITDLEHDIENTKFDIQKGYKYAKQLKDLRTERRQMKNEIEMLESLNTFIINNKKLEIDLFKIKTSMLKIKEKQEFWVYVPRVPEGDVKEVSK